MSLFFAQWGGEGGGGGRSQSRKKKATRFTLGLLFSSSPILLTNSDRKRRPCSPRTAEIHTSRTKSHPEKASSPQPCLWPSLNCKRPLRASRSHPPRGPQSSSPPFPDDHHRRSLFPKQVSTGFPSVSPRLLLEILFFRTRETIRSCEFETHTGNHASGLSFQSTHSPPLACSPNLDDEVRLIRLYFHLVVQTLPSGSPRAGTSIQRKPTPPTSRLPSSGPANPSSN